MEPIDWRNKTVLITGGTGSLGRALTRIMLEEHHPRRLIIFSRDELKQYEMRQQFPVDRYPNIRYFIGDVRDKERLYRAFDGVDIVIHAAALKQVPAAEYNPIEPIKTNILGASNVIDAAIDRGVRKVIALSTDKAANPINLYGATKLCSDKLFTAANNYAGYEGTRFSVVRYGNVLNSRGSVVPLFMKMRATGVIPVTDPNMTRFWITLEQAVDFVVKSLARMQGGEIFVPKIPSMTMLGLARAVAPECEIKEIGIRPGEKMHEIMVPPDEARNTVEYDDYFAMLPAFHDWDRDAFIEQSGGAWCAPGFQYSSDHNDLWLTVDELRALIGWQEATTVE